MSFENIYVLVLSSSGEEGTTPFLSHAVEVEAKAGAEVSFGQEEGARRTRIQHASNPGHVVTSQMAHTRVERH